MSEQEIREKVIKGLERCSSAEECGKQCPYWNDEGACRTHLEADALALLKAQNTSLETIAEDHGLTPDGVSFALDQYQTVISEITHGMMSKLTYNAKDILQMAQERWCNTCELMKAQEPVEPVFERQFMSNIEIYDCGKCGTSLGAKGIAKYCMKCGREVKWE